MAKYAQQLQDFKSAYTPFLKQQLEKEKQTIILHFV